jgi:hypothetical protein
LVFVTGNIPAREKRVIVEGTQTVNVTGDGGLPQSKAKGLVLFSNLTQDSVTIPSGTIVSADSIQFVTLDEVIVSAGVGRKIEAAVEALEPGLSGNVDAGAIDTISGRLSLFVSVNNPGSTGGGLELASVQASDQDRQRAKELLMAFLDGEASENIFTEIGRDDVLFNDSIAISQILSETYDPPAGAAGATLTLTMQVEYSARYASASDLSQLASLALNASIPSGFSPASEAVKIESLGLPVLNEDGSARWQIRAERQIAQRDSSRSSNSWARDNFRPNSVGGIPSARKRT